MEPTFPRGDKGSLELFPPFRRHRGHCSFVYIVWAWRQVPHLPLHLLSGREHETVRVPHWHWEPGWGSSLAPWADIFPRSGLCCSERVMLLPGPPWKKVFMVVFPFILHHSMRDESASVFQREFLGWFLILALLAHSAVCSHFMNLFNHVLTCVTSVPQLHLWSLTAVHFVHLFFLPFVNMYDSGWVRIQWHYLLHSHSCWLPGDLITTRQSFHFSCHISTHSHACCFNQVTVFLFSSFICLSKLLQVLSTAPLHNFFTSSYIRLNLASFPPLAHSEGCSPLHALPCVNLYDFFTSAPFLDEKLHFTSPCLNIWGFCARAPCIKSGWVRIH